MMKEDKNSIQIKNFLDVPMVGSSDQLVDSIVNQISDSDSGYAGFSTKEDLKTYLEEEIFDGKKSTVHSGIESKISSKEIENQIIVALQGCQKIIPTEQTQAYVFPTLSSFVAEKMNGVSGFTPWKGVIHIFVHSNLNQDNWKEYVTATVYHEYDHSVMYRYAEWNTVLDTLIFEGMAELFRKENLGGEDPAWIHTFSQDEGKRLLKKLKPKLHEPSDFLNHPEFHHWLKYTLGFQIVTSFREKNKDLQWSEMFKLSPQYVFDNAGFLD